MTKLNRQDTTIAVLALVKYGNVAPRLMEALLRYYGTIEMILASDAGTLMAISGITPEIANSIAQSSDYLSEAKTYYQLLQDKSIHILTRFDKEYPHNLFELHNPPTVLFYRGSFPEPQKKSVTIVGTQIASIEGIEFTTSIAKKFAESGVQVISGLQTGINVSSHLGARANEGKTFAILESGLEQIYPEENRPVAIDVVQNGGLISEFTEDTEFENENVESSNRLLAAMSQAVIVTEFYKDDTFVYDILDCCAEIGKMVFVLINPKHNLVDTEALNYAVKSGAIPLVGLETLEDISKSLV